MPRGKGEASQTIVGSFAVLDQAWTKATPILIAENRLVFEAHRFLAIVDPCLNGSGQLGLHRDGLRRIRSNRFHAS